jgi:hypothetical protein
VGAEEEGPRRAVVVAREIDHRGVLLPRLQLLDTGRGRGVGFGLRRRLAGWRWGSGFRPGLRLRRRHGERGTLGAWGFGGTGRRSGRFWVAGRKRTFEGVFLMFR